MKPDKSLKSSLYWVGILALLVTTIACSFATNRLAAIQKLVSPAFGKIAYAGSDGNIYTIDPNGNRQKAVTKDAGGDVQSYQFPAWSPDSQRLSFLSIRNGSSATQSASVDTSGPDGGDRVEVFKSSKELPFYFYWSPNSQYLSFLASSGANQDLNFHLVSRLGGDDRLLGTGSPFYWDWSPDSNTIIVHVGGDATNNPDARLSLLSLDPRNEQKLSLRPGFFQAPAWSPDGSEMLLSIEDSNGRNVLQLLGKDAAVVKTVDTSVGPFAFGWSASGRKIAYLVPQGATPQSFFRALKLYDQETQQSKVIDPEDEVMAFFWSPDSKKIAYFVPAGAPQPGGSRGIAQTTPTLLLSLNIYDLNSQASYQVASFTPSDALLNLIPFFDQYQHSVEIWSPDSQQLVISALDQASMPGIYVLNAAPGQRMTRIAAGNQAFWSWK